VEDCEITSGDYEHEHHFYNAQQLEAYACEYLRKKRRQAQLKAKRRQLNGKKVSVRAKKVG
jgi:hypothetical protein